MSRVTSKLQVTIPKAIADRYGIVPGQDVEWLPAGEAIRVVPQTLRRPRRNTADWLAMFDEATERQREREHRDPALVGTGGDRGWKREDLYERDSAR
jgi:bifunctional DNA-binding transcriptional regulator/antitoxin component of YhaV-PrlF toxin-antitoxin module